MATPHGQSAIKVKGYPHNLTECRDAPSGFVETAQHKDMLAKMMLTHTVGDFCLIGKKVKEAGNVSCLCHLVCTE